MEGSPLVAVIDDDESVRESLPDLLRECGYRVEAFACGEAFLDSEYLDVTQCLILDIAMPGMSGPDLQRELQKRGRTTPVIFITGHGGAADRQQLMREGAVDCLIKPFNDADLLRALAIALL